MEKAIVCLLLGAMCIYFGILQRKGNLSTLHSYHRKRVSEADRIPFGRVVGLGTIIMGAGILLMGIFTLLATVFEIETFALFGMIFMIIGMAVGLVISIYAMIKYNKGIFK